MVLVVAAVGFFLLIYLAQSYECSLSSSSLQQSHWLTRFKAIEKIRDALKIKQTSLSAARSDQSDSQGSQNQLKKRKNDPRLRQAIAMLNPNSTNSAIRRLAIVSGHQMPPASPATKQQLLSPAIGQSLANKIARPSSALQICFPAR